MRNMDSRQMVRRVEGKLGQMCSTFNGAIAWKYHKGLQKQVQEMFKGLLMQFSYRLKPLLYFTNRVSNFLSVSSGNDP